MKEKNTGAFIASLRRERSLTQKQLAEKLNVTDKAVSKWETGRGYPDIDSLMALSKYFGVSVNELLIGEHLSSEKKQKEAQKNIAAELISEKQRRRHSRWVVIAVIVLTAVFLVELVLNVRHSVGGVIDHLQTLNSSDSVCHITADYSEIEICGVPYERVYRMIDEVRDCIWEQDKLLCDKPLVGTQLSLSDKVYSVKFCDNYDYICLRQDAMYEDAVFCKADKVEKARQHSDKDKKIYYIRENVDDNKRNVTELSDNFTRSVDSLSEDDCYNSWYPEGDSYDIYFRFADSPLLYFYGYLGEENGRYFITFSEGDIDALQDITYRLDESVYEELSKSLPTEQE